MVEIGKTLRKFRLNSGLTQQDIADKLDVTRAAVGQWEADKTMPRKGSLEMLADLFGITVSELMGDDYPAGALPFETGDDAAVPLRAAGRKSTGGGGCGIMVIFPRWVVDEVGDPDAFALEAGPSTNLRYPEGCHLLVSPCAEPVDGCAVAYELDGETGVRVLRRGSSTIMLSPDSTDRAIRDIVLADGEMGGIKIQGVVRWYQAPGVEPEKGRRV